MTGAEVVGAGLGLGVGVTEGATGVATEEVGLTAEGWT